MVGNTHTPQKKTKCQCSSLLTKRNIAHTVCSGDNHQPTPSEEQSLLPDILYRLNHVNSTTPPGDVMSDWPI